MWYLPLDFARVFSSESSSFRIPRSLADQSLIAISTTSICAHDDYGHPHDWSLSSKSTGRTDWHVAKGYGETRRALVRLNNRAHLCYWSYICGLDALCFEYSISRNVAVISYDRESSFPENDASDYASLALLANAYRGRFLWKL